MRLKLVYAAIKSQKEDEHSGMTSPMTGYDWPGHAGLTQTTQLDTTQLDTDSLAIVPFDAPEGYGAAGPVPPDEEALLRSRSSDQILEEHCSDEEAPRAIVICRPVPSLPIIRSWC